MRKIILPFWHVFYVTVIFVFVILALWQRVKENQYYNSNDIIENDYDFEDDEFINDKIGKKNYLEDSEVAKYDFEEPDKILLKKAKRTFNKNQRKRIRKVRNARQNYVKRATRSLEIESEHYYEVYLNHMYYMKPHLSKMEIDLILKRAKTEDSYRKATGNTAGELYAMTFNSHEVNLTRLDRNTLNRVEMEIVVDAMCTVLPNLKEKIQKIIKWEGQVHDLKAHGSDMDRHRQTESYQMCLMERNTICNGHLPPRFHCTCHVTPHLQNRLEAPLCDDLYKIKFPKKHVLTYAILFPVTKIMSILPEQFFTQFLNYYTTFVKNANRIIILRRACIDKKMYVFQVAFLRREPLRSVSNALPYTDEHFDGFWMEILKPERAWFSQALLNHVSLRQFDELLPTDITKMRWYREVIAKMETFKCFDTLNWTYGNYWKCRSHEIIFLTFCPLFIGIVLGVIRLYYFIEGYSERSLAGKQVNINSTSLNNRNESLSIYKLNPTSKQPLLSWSKTTVDELINQNTKTKR